MSQNVFKFTDKTGVAQKIMRHNIDHYYRGENGVLVIEYMRGGQLCYCMVDGTNADVLETAIDNGVLDIMIGDDEA